MRKLAFILFLQFLVSCGAAPSNDSDLDSVVLDKASGRWPEPRAIPVCVMNRSDVGDALFNDVKQYVTSEYSAKAGVGLVGWEDCTKEQLTAKVVRVRFNLTHNWSNNGGVTAGGGLSMVGMSKSSCGTDCVGGTMRLDIGKEGDYPSDLSYQAFITSRTRATAVHEFGHALGLMHEHGRSDAVGCAKADGSVAASATNIYVGSYDATSIMNYCHAGSITTLSSGDVEGLYYLYPSLATGH